jgi:phosphonate metabolism-associated iron-containing alcohol dehydrogenase
MEAPLAASTTGAAFNWDMPVRVRFGSGCSETLADELEHRECVVLAFDRAAALGLKQRWQARLGARCLAWIDVPDALSSLDLAQGLALRVWPALTDAPRAVLIALGGGSTLDLAKVLRCLPTDHDFRGIARAIRAESRWPEFRRVPLWAVPTTAGTGSEVTRWATVWDTDAQPVLKRSLDEPWGHADRAFVDPTLTHSCPLSLTRDVALDTLAHALESIWNRHANPVSSQLALSAAHAVILNLPDCLAHPDDGPTREALALASLQAGLAFSQTRTALAHALSYDLTAQRGIPHGLACALWLPRTWSLAIGHDDTVDQLLRQVFDLPPQESVQALTRWLSTVGVPEGPEAVGISDAAARVSEALNSARGRNFIAHPSERNALPS